MSTSKAGVIRSLYEAAEELSITCISLSDDAARERVYEEVGFPGDILKLRDNMILTASLLVDVADRCLVWDNTPQVVLTRLRMLVQLILLGLDPDPAATFEGRWSRLHNLFEVGSGIRLVGVFPCYNQFLKIISLEITRYVSTPRNYQHKVYRDGVL